ncbi:MAG: guanylate kinase [Clostridiales bacterium]|nr:guanylate kinase [Clostridiales bacterium]
MCKEGNDIGSKLVVVSGPSGAGKDTIAAEIIKLDGKFSLSVSATTRAPREGEVDGVNYFFLSEDEFLQNIRDNAFIEYAKYSSNYYGTLKRDVQSKIAEGKIIILVIDVQGAEKIKKEYPDSLSLFIMPPSKEILRQRLNDRMTEDNADIEKRIKIAEDEMKKRSSYDYVVVNDDLNAAVSEVYDIITKSH